ncbi:unnamed protein product [Acanthoscelides obtectus]|uniref:Vacuolar protein sorting-associated protein 13D n=1 Tax=Acanthoscelides obtectus TaxID=200917 RepID=A0A9P0PQQ2_ACAOB|nr:unnamed protein product [Acanthoscelides obtectus]CAK1626706.1 Vacuolar protein sorting-associated protein 13D [Acanthoscelides obtectus]
MLEGLVAWVLNNYLGKYVQLNTDQLSIALLSGKVELENLPLKEDALRHLGLPIIIKAGFIGKVQLHIPVRQIRSAPWVIIIEQLYLVASPLPLHEWDNEAEELARHDQKLYGLDTLEAKWRLDRDVQDLNSAYYASSYSSWYSYGTGLVTEIIENLQLRIQDVHIRYEDNISVPSKCIAFGITIESLIAQSCDSNWQPGYVQASKSEESFKLLELQKFALYWMTLDESGLLSNLTVAQLAEAMSPGKIKKTTKNYIVPSVSVQAHLKRNRSTHPLRSTTPRIVCDLIVEEVALSLIDWQYDQIVSCVRGLDDIARLRSYRRFKPSSSVKQDPKAWWLYAISNFYPGGQPNVCRPRPTWENCIRRARQNVKYVEVYKKLLVSPTAALGPEEVKLKNEVEWEREFDELKTLRELAMSSVKLPNPNGTTTAAKSTGRSIVFSWFPTWMGWYSSGSAESSATSSPEATQLEGEILQALADSAENNTILKRDAVFGHFNFCLKTGTLNLCTVGEHGSDSSPMLELEFKTLSITILSKPRTSSHTIELSLGAVFLKDKITLNTMFPVLVGPPGFDRTAVPRGKGPNPRFSANNSRVEDTLDHLFYLEYEKKPPNSVCDYSLRVKSKCLDVVYQPNAVKWLTEFVCLPHQRDITQSQIEAMKSRTKKELIKNWEQILEGRVVGRTSWDLEFDISAPQIIFVEQFTDQNSAMAVIDFGKLQLRNNMDKVEVPPKPEFITKESEEDETFVTPCSTPPASEASDSGEQTLEPVSQIDESPEADHPLNEKDLYNKLYDCYFLELTDMQILIGKPKDNWRYALNKGSSNLHVLDRFSILLQIERRVVHTSDPLYPSLTLNANLPKLVVHLNENKITSARNLVHYITTTGLPSPFKSAPETMETSPEHPQEEESESIDTSAEMSKLIMMQFTVDQLSLEIQSRGRSVAELQVSGVKTAFTKRSVDIGITLTVHSLLLVDALQTFGADFELLVASHKHVGMDSMSGSLRDSEPTSPTSPGSPDPNVTRNGATSPVALTQALSTLATSPPLRWASTSSTTNGMSRNGTFVGMGPATADAEALISIEVMLITGQEPMQIANVQFNNLDIIANQETIVELMGFIRRVFPKSRKPAMTTLSSYVSSSVQHSTESLLDEPDSAAIGTTNTQITFDFHRLNVLLLRGVVKDGSLYGKKICTATMTEAKIQANVSSKLEVEGSLGGLQVLDLTPEGYMHQRIISVGRDPLQETPHPMYLIPQQQDDRTAFSFKVRRNLEAPCGKDKADIIIRMASLWYTHSPVFIAELQSCATEFKQYLSNLARSIKIAATDMALGLVHARAEALAQSLSMNKRLPSSLYGSALSFTESASPSRRRRRSSSADASGYASARDTVPQTPYSPADDDDFIIDLMLNIELDSPVVVLPRKSNSPEVFVAHLGKISVSNYYIDDSKTNGYDYDCSDFRIEHYDIEVKDMNIYSLDTSTRRVPGPSISKPEVLYSCSSLAKPILYDTMLHLKIDREVCKDMTRYSSESNLLLDDDDTTQSSYLNPGENIQVSGSIVTALKISLTRSQYAQLLDTVDWLTSSPKLSETQGISRLHLRPQASLSDICEEDTGVTTLNMDPHVRAKLFPVSNLGKAKKQTQPAVAIKVNFDVPVFTVELRGETPIGEQGLVDLSFRDFAFNYEKCHRYDTNIQISLRSIFMEDLLQPEGSKQRAMVLSSSGDDQVPNAACISRSCPDVTYHRYRTSSSHGSLPDHLETAKVFGMDSMTTSMHRTEEYPCTPPPSPSRRNRRRARPEKNLVIISTLLVDPSAPNFEEQYKGIQKSTSIDFNCLDLVISVKSWVVVLDFFNISSEPEANPGRNLSTSTGGSQQVVSSTKQVTNITVKSLTVTLVTPDRDIAKANISNVEVEVRTAGLLKEVDGKLGSMSLQDLTLHGQLYRERFVTSGEQVLQFKYMRHIPDVEKNYDAQLTLNMASVTYVHTRRFIAEIYAFFNKFTERRQMVMRGIQAATSGQSIRDEPSRLSLILEAKSPIILLPVSSKSSDVLVVDLGQLLVTNDFKYSGDPGTISVQTDNNNKKCLLNVMFLKLEHMDLYAGMKESELSPSKRSLNKNCFKLGSSLVTKKGPSLLTKKFQLKLQVEQNLYRHLYHIVPDMSIYGQLSTLDGTLDLSQYRLIRGLLAYNLGEDTERINPSVPTKNISAEADHTEEWKLSSVKLDMQNVTLRLVQSHETNSPLTCINFIKSHLTVENFSNFCQDVDLVSQEILIMDTRFNGVEPNDRYNVFTNILQPIRSSKNPNGLVQAEVHSRKRQDYTKVTILLNDMRLMAIFDWWEALQQYIFQEIENVSSSPEHHSTMATLEVQEEVQFDLKLNITDSEIVLVENTAQWDTNAVILKSTTVLKYRPYNQEKPLYCSLNNCEMFSCVLGMEEETALSIIDPVTLNIEINKDNVLEVQMQFLIVRLSYHDMCMFKKMLNSLPKQIIFEKSADVTSKAIKQQIASLTGLGFKVDDCLVALEKCKNRLDDSAIWLTHNATPEPSAKRSCNKGLNISAVEVKANRLSICIIDDCGDSDVPLLELSFSDLQLYQLLPELNVNDPVSPQGYLDCSLASDYYNRVLSGWEPIIEPWRCKILWEKILSQAILKNRLAVKVESEETLDFDVTSTLIELYQQVKETWTKDYSKQLPNGSTDSSKPSSAIECFRRRSPFIPFALKNDTGSPLIFTTHISDVNSASTPVVYKSYESWTSVDSGETVPFSFKTRDKIRHQDSHMMRLHQLGVKIDGWQCIDPVTVDKVGIYFRDAPADVQSRSLDVPPVRIVFDVTLEGSARKLVTVRSALLLINNLPQPVEIKLEPRLPQEANYIWVPTKTYNVDKKATLAVPLAHARSQISMKPSGLAQKYTYCTPTSNWMDMPPNVDRAYELETCHTHKGHNYRFCQEIVKENVLVPTSNRYEQPAHRIFLWPTIKLENLLPVDIDYVLSGEKGRIKAGATASITTVDPDKTVSLEVILEGFETCNAIVVPAGCTNEFTGRIKLEDSKHRKLYLLAYISLNKSAKVKITITAYFWIINRTGLPLVFRQSGTSTESAGQFEEHEQARMVTPFLFSFSDQDASPTLNARVGKMVVFDGTSQWCSNFHVQKGTQYRKLHVSMRGGSPDTVFVVGIEVRPGRGKYRSTSIITISPRYQLHNRSSYRLLFAQMCAAKGSNGDYHNPQKAFLKLMPDSHMPFHWSNLEKDQLLCVSIEDVPDCCWSGGLKIDTNTSMHVNVRDGNGRVYFLRLEVVLQGATFFVVFTDADTMPPPIRVDNFSEVSITFGQSCCVDVMHSTARAHSSVPYAWDEPTRDHSVRLVAPGGVSNTYRVSMLGPAPGLTYENFIYIAFTGTFKSHHPGVRDPNNVECQELVLDVAKSALVYLNHKIPGERSQLWRMTSEGYLQHEGSSPPLHPNQSRSRSNTLVLDIESTAPQPNTYSRLMLRRIDPRRRSTQKWRFTEEGRLCCDHHNMCVQAMDGFYGLRAGNAAVLGLPQPVCHKVTEKGLPIEQHIEHQRLRPGSGFLSVDIHMDGPTQVISIKDIKESKVYASPDDREWGTISQSQRPNLSSTDEVPSPENSKELQFGVNLKGLGVSLVCRKAPEELLYAHFAKIVGETVITSKSKKLSISVKDIQIDNQLLDTSVPVVVHMTPPSSRNNDEAYDHLPALDFNAEMQQQVNENAVIFKHLMLRLKKITIVIEEMLLLKLCSFMGLHSQEEELIDKDESDYETQRLLTEVSAAHAKRYYFGLLKLIPDQIRLSVKTASKLPKQLQKIKRKLGLTLIKFEDAAIELEAFQREHPFETSQVLFKSIIKHFKDELMWQAGIILGSVDFIGNPLGLMNDVSEGLSGFLYEGNVGALVKNVTHGMSNSAAKITESLSDGLGKVAMDDYHEEMRQKIRQVQSGKSSDHILAGFKGLGFGILGGATGIFKQVYEGASNDGIQGVFSGLGKGIVGAVTKPVVGVLDFASETARAVRDSSRSKLTPERIRLPRCTHGPGGLLPRYNLKQSQGQQYLYIVNDKNYDEQLVAYQVLGSASENLICIVSNKMIRIVTSIRSPDLTPVIECPLSDLETCNVITEKEHGESRFYIEIVMHYAGVSAALVNPDPVKKPRVRCRTLELASTVSQQINYAKRIYIEHLYTFTTDNITTLED